MPLLGTIALIAALGAAAPDPGLAPGLDPDPQVAMHRVRVRVVAELIEQGKADLALEAAGRLVRERPQDALTRMALGQALEANGLLVEAAESYRRAARLSRRDAAPRDLLGRVLARMGRTKEAVAELRRAADLEPFNATIWNDLGFTLLLAGEAERAVEALRRAVELAPAGRRARTNLGFALAALGRDEEALRAFRALHRPADAYANLGLARERRGDVEGAAALYREALALDPDHEAARINLQRLRAAGAAEEVSHVSK